MSMLCLIPHSASHVPYQRPFLCKLHITIYIWKPSCSNFSSRAFDGDCGIITIIQPCSNANLCNDNDNSEKDRKHQAFTDDPWHYLSCPNLISNEGTARHSNISLYLKTSALNCGCFARSEPRDLSKDDHKRPDVELFTLPTSTLIDVVVCNSVAPSHAPSTRTKPLAVADQAARKKNKKYQTM